MTIKEHGDPAARISVLRHLIPMRAPISMTALGKLTEMTTHALRHHIRNLEEEGFVLTNKDQWDKRITLVNATRSGRDFIIRLNRKQKRNANHSQ